MAAHLTLVADNSAQHPSRRVPESKAPDLPRDISRRERILAGLTLLLAPLWALRAWLEMLRSKSRSRRKEVDLREERGAVTAEYAVVILAAVAFAGLLVVIMRSDEVRQMLVDLVQGALNSAG